MTRLWRSAEAVSVQCNEAGLPVSLVWQGVQHRIQQIRQEWEIDTDWYEDHLARRYFAVTTTSGLLCVLYEDRLSGGWYISKIYD